MPQTAPDAMTNDQHFGDGRVRFSRVGPVAVIEICNPPVNAGSHLVRSGLLAALAQAAEEPDLQGAVLAGAGGIFMAGSDISEFGAPFGDPQLPAVIAAIEALPIPVVAALEGAALGGGLELALACDARVARPGTALGLPEVSLGMVPGAGGTQRLPRLVGLAKAMELICGARRVKAEEALSLGIVDRLAEEDLREAAMATVLEMVGRKNPVIGRRCPVTAPGELEAARTAALKAGKNRPAVREAVRLIELAAQASPADALAEERRTFQEIRLSEEAFALRHLFFAERRASRIEGLTDDPLPVERVGVVGAGTMGAAISYAFLRAGYPVVLVERSADALKAGTGRLDGLVSKDLGSRRISDDAAAAVRQRLTTATDIAAMASCDVIIEAVFEDLAVKSQLLSELNAITGETCILASNTSYLDLNVLAAASGRPDRVVGLHFFSPAHVMKLLEIVRGTETSGAVLATALRIGRKLGKTSIVAKVGEGFVGNRIYAAYRNQAEMLAEEGALPWDIDRTLEEFGFAMGPFKVSDLSGLDIAWKTRQRLAATRDPQARYVRLPDLVCERGRLGRKTGAGWYNYASGTPEPDPTIVALIESEAAAAGRTLRAIDPAEIRQRMLAAIVNEAACVLEDGIAQRASDVDVAFVNGYGFARWLGGPIWWASRRDRGKILAAVDTLAEAVGHGFRRGPVVALLDGIA